MANIKKLSARPILDSRGNWTIEVGLSAGSWRVIASVPHGKSSGSHEVESLPAEKAVRNVEKIIFPKLRGKSVLRQRELDDLMIKLDGTRGKRRLGGNAILGVSVAVAKAAAAEKGVPLWKYFRSLSGLAVKEKHGGIVYPRLYANLVNGGLHAGNNLDFQEYIVIPKTRTFHESVSMIALIYHALGEYLSRSKGKEALNIGDEGGYAPDFRDNAEPFRILKRVVASLKLQRSVDFGMDAAATDVKMKSAELFKFYRKAVRDFPLAYIEDPFGEEKFLQFAALREMLGGKIAVAGDDLTTTNVSRMEMAHANGSVNAVIIKPNQIGTVSETMDAVRAARKYGWKIVVSHRSGETDDDFIADLAYGIGADGFKLGSPARGERVAKYNRLLEIERLK